MQIPRGLPAYQEPIGPRATNEREERESARDRRESVSADKILNFHMPVRIAKSWIPLTEENVKRLSGQLGVYQIQDHSGHVAFIGYAGGRSLFGLRGELQRELARRTSGHNFRYEITMQYMTRYKELLMVHAADQGELPPDNRHSRRLQLGRMSP